ncbi:MAG: hypothetical protein FJZ92_10645 [Chloroflexi bacterium]|nr:hypothetical protein [Chloroflexota bacterium]
MSATFNPPTATIQPPGMITDRIGRHLRDGTLQDILAAAILVSAARARLGESDPCMAQEMLDEAAALLAMSAASLRAVIGRLEDANAADDCCDGKGRRRA